MHIIREVDKKEKHLDGHFTPGTFRSNAFLIPFLAHDILEVAYKFQTCVQK